MESQKFIRSWPALWLWLKYLTPYLQGSVVETSYTFRKARLDIHFIKVDSCYRLSWEKQGNGALLTFTQQATLPKKRVDVLRSLSGKFKLADLELNVKDRALKFNFSEDRHLILGFFPTALNVYLYRGDALLDSFLKYTTPPGLSNVWLTADDPLPEAIPGKHISRDDLMNAEHGMTIAPLTSEVLWGKKQAEQQLSIAELVQQVLKSGNKPKSSPKVSLRKTGATVLKRWQGKLRKMTLELEEADQWPEWEIKMQVLQIAQGLNIPIQNGKLSLEADMSPTGAAITIDIAQETNLSRVIETTARKIRKFKLKIDQLQAVSAEVEQDIRELTQLLSANDAETLLLYLQNKGEALDQTGTRKTERKSYKKYTSPNGFDILVGRSSRDNDILTFKVANKYDWWFHARQVHGSHVILRTGKRVPSQIDLQKAAEYAALNSKARHSQLVVVQYCQRKHLSKPRGSSPGTVLVHQEKTITIDLDQRH